MSIEAIKKALEGVTREEAIQFMDIAMRNWGNTPPLDEDDIMDLAEELTRFSDRRCAPEIARLQRENAALKIDVTREAELATHMASDCNDAQARVKVLEAALKPFAEEEPDHMDISEDNEVVTPHLDLVYGDFRRARTALASTGGEHHGN